MPTTRDRSGSIQLDDVKALLKQMEDNLTSQISSVYLKIEGLEKAIKVVQTNQIRLDNEISEMRQVVISQQKQIEKFEAERREKNIVIHGIPEEAVSVDDTELSTDDEKVAYLLNVVEESERFRSAIRLGKRGIGRKRPLLVKLYEKSQRNSLLFEQKKLRNDVCCKNSFGPIYVNRDSSFLMRKEEKRLREKIKSIRASKNESDRIYWKRDKLLLNGEIVDSIDISNQLF